VLKRALLVAKPAVAQQARLVHAVSWLQCTHKMMGMVVESYRTLLLLLLRACCSTKSTYPMCAL
jgi:hypothetical protein